MKPPGHMPPDDVRPRNVRLVLGRVVAAGPATLGSLLLMTLVSVTLGRWMALLPPLAWAAGAAVLMTRFGERLTVRAACGFRRPSPAQAAELGPAWSTALSMTGTAGGDVELYVQTAAAPNAFAAGGRSVAVTSRVLADHASGRLPHGPLVAVLVHELGHHAGGVTRSMLLLAWLTAPWRAAATVVAGLASLVSGRHRRRGLGVVVLAGVGMAAVRVVQRGEWMAGGVLSVLGLAAVLVPLANAAISRRCEYAADRFAADHGFAAELTAALRVLSDGTAPRGWSRLWSTHPTVEQRIKALAAQPSAMCPTGNAIDMWTSTAQDPQDRVAGRGSRRVEAAGAVLGKSRRSPSG